MITVEQIRTIIASNWESDLPEQVLDVLKRNNGKRLTVRLLDSLPGGREAWRISYGFATTLETWTYTRSGGHGGIHLLLAHKDKNVVIDAAWVEKQNPAYFEARAIRNARRMTLQNDNEALSSIAYRLERVDQMRKQLKVVAELLERSLDNVPDAREIMQLIDNEE